MDYIFIQWNMMKKSNFKFIVDTMCGKLAKWLRIIGFDTEYYSKGSDDNLIKLAKEQDRNKNKEYQNKDPNEKIFFSLHALFIYSMLFRKQCFNPCRDHVHGDFIQPPFRDNHIGISFGWFHELKVHGPYC